MDNKLEFIEVFRRGHVLDNDDDIQLLLKCRNIHFDHNVWSYHIIRKKYVIKYIVDNIVDINMIEYAYSNTTLLSNLIKAGNLSNTAESIRYVLNNGHIGNNTFDCARYRTCAHFLDKYKCLVEYLTKVSLDRFTRFYNVEKYYDIGTILLLIMKVYQKIPREVALKSLPQEIALKSSLNNGHSQWLPSNIIKHLVLPFVYK